LVQRFGYRFLWLKIGRSGWLLWILQWTFGFLEGRESFYSWEAFKLHGQISRNVVTHNHGREKERQRELSLPVGTIKGKAVLLRALITGGGRRLFWGPQSTGGENTALTSRALMERFLTRSIFSSNGSCFEKSIRRPRSAQLESDPSVLVTVFY
jgi:hypothetical protein